MTDLPENWPTFFPYAPWYLDAVTAQWEYVATYDGNNRVTGILPFCIKSRMGLRLLTPPPLSPRLGPQIFYPEGVNFRQKQAFEWKILTALEQQLPTVHHAKINWPYELSNGLPWQMAGWEQRVRYSYCIDLKQAEVVIWHNFKHRVRWQIRKAQRVLRVNSNTDMNQLWRFYQHTYQAKGKPPFLSEKLLKSVVKTALKQKKAMLFEAADDQNRTHAILFLIWDKQTAYYLLSFSDTQLRSSGAPSLLIWYAIRYAQSMGLKTFDFEGSQLPGVEAFFRSFGGEARPYFQFTKTKKWLKVANSLFSGGVH